MIKFQGRSSLKQYMPEKPGIKVWVYIKGSHLRSVGDEDLQLWHCKEGQKGISQEVAGCQTEDQVNI
jgi:hypothetical protein